MKQVSRKTIFALCIENKDCDDLEKGKVYQVLPDDTAAQEGYLRVVDESREDYLYHGTLFSSNYRKRRRRPSRSKADERILGLHRRHEGWLRSSLVIWTPPVCQGRLRCGAGQA